MCQISRKTTSCYYPSWKNSDDALAYNRLAEMSLDIFSLCSGRTACLYCQQYLTVPIGVMAHLHRATHEQYPAGMSYISPLFIAWVLDAIKSSASRSARFSYDLQSIKKHVCRTMQQLPHSDINKTKAYLWQLDDNSFSQQPRSQFTPLLESPLELNFLNRL